MFRPNTHGTLARRGARNLHGKASYSPTIPIPLAVVRLASLVEQTTVRADSSASRGAASELTTEAVLLLPRTIKVSTGDRISVAGVTISVSEVHPRLSVLGQLDHYEVGGSIEQQK